MITTLNGVAAAPLIAAVASAVSLTELVPKMRRKYSGIVTSCAATRLPSLLTGTRLPTKENLYVERYCLYYRVKRDRVMGIRNCRIFLAVTILSTGVISWQA
jgi:hypothetical protein